MRYVVFFVAVFFFFHKKRYVKMSRSSIALYSPSVLFAVTRMPYTYLLERALVSPGVVTARVAFVLVRCVGKQRSGL